MFTLHNLDDIVSIVNHCIALFTGWPLFWKTWKSQGIEKWSGKIGRIREKSGKMNYYNYSVAAIIVQTIIGDYNNSTIDHSQLIFDFTFPAKVSHIYNNSLLRPT